MAIAEGVADPAARERINELIKVGFSPRQAFALETRQPWTQAKLNEHGLFTFHQVRALTAVTPTEADLIRKAHLTRAQGELVVRFYLS